MTQQAILVQHTVALARSQRLLALVHEGFSIFVPMHGRCGCLFNPPGQTDHSAYWRPIAYDEFVANARTFLEHVERGSNLGITGSHGLISGISRCDSHQLVLVN
jgi:hypothetical protein